MIGYGKSPALRGFFMYIRMIYLIYSFERKTMNITELWKILVIGFIIYQIIKNWNKPHKPPKYRGHVCITKR